LKLQGSYHFSSIIDRKFLFATTLSFRNFGLSGENQNNNIVLLQNNFQTYFPSDVNFSKMYNVINCYDELKNYNNNNNNVMRTENGFIIWGRLERDEHLKINMMQGTTFL
jgi:pullulanase/glycogen debranching enzyme